MQKLKKLLVLPLILLISLTATGATLSLHKCCGKLKTFAINTHSKGCKKETPEKPSCHKQAEQGKKPCCDNTTVAFKQDYKKKIGDDKSSTALQPLLSIAVTQPSLLFNFFEHFHPLVYETLVDRGPLHILYRIFRN